MPSGARISNIKSSVEKVCENPDCKKSFWSFRKGEKYCSYECRRHMHYVKSKNKMNHWREENKDRIKFFSKKYLLNRDEKKKQRRLKEVALERIYGK